MSEMKRKDSKSQTKKHLVSGNESEYSSYDDERESENESPVRKSRAPSKTKVVKAEQKDDMGLQPQDVVRRRRGGNRSGRGRARRGRSQSRRRSGSRRSSRSRRRR